MLLPSANSRVSQNPRAALLECSPSRLLGCNMKINQAFMMQGDGMHNAAALLPELVEDGVRLLIYAGNAGE